MVNASVPLSVVNRSLATTSVGPISLNGAVFNGEIPFGDNTAVTLSVPQVRLPYPAATNRTDFAGSYEWTIPAGWQFESFPGTTARTTTNLVRVIPSPAGVGSISVRALDTFCNSYLLAGQNVSRTEPFVQPVTRPLPTLRISSNGAPTTIFCGDQTDYGFRAELLGAGLGGRLTAYAWTVSGAGWSPATAAVVAPAILPSGNSGATIALTATYERNGATATVRASNVVIGYSQQLPTTVFVESNFDLCLRQNKRYEVQPIKGAVTYRWTATPASLIPGGSATTTVPYLDITGPDTEAITTGQVRVEVSNPVFGCTPSSAVANFQIGGGSASLSISAGYYGYVCPYTPVVFAVKRTNARGQDRYEWSVDGQVVSTNPGSLQLDGPMPGESLYVSVLITNDCGGGFQLGGVVYGAGAIGGLPCQALRTAPTAGPKVYPNPADAELTVDLAVGLPDGLAAERRGQVRLFNSQGQQVRQAPARGPQLTLDIRSLPEGLYQLHVPTATGVSRQQIQIRH